MAPRFFLGFLATALPAMAQAPGPAIVFADGRREAVTEPRQDSEGRWTAVCEGRRTVLRAGEVVVVVDASGKETVTIPALLTNPDTPESLAQLSRLRDPKNTHWSDACEQLAAKPTQTMNDALVKLAADKTKDLRKRAYAALARMRTKESVKACAQAILAEKDAALRRESTSMLFSVQEIFKRSDTADLVKGGLADKDAVVRVSFALLAPADLDAAAAILRADGVKNGDHHIRESAAMALGRRGDPAGESILIGMLTRTSIPGFDGGEALMTKILTQEQVEVCAVLGKFGSDNSKAALKKAASSRHEAVRKAAEAALAGK